MISAFANTLKIPELRDRILFTLAMIVIVRIGSAITLPGVDASVLQMWVKEATENAIHQRVDHDAAFVCCSSAFE